MNSKIKKIIMLILIPIVFIVIFVASFIVALTNSSISANGYEFSDEPGIDSNEKISATAGIRGYYKSRCSGRTFTEYYQNDGGAWNWESGCWISSQATIMSGFGSKYTPNELPGWHGDAQQYTWKQYGNCQYERVYNVKASDIKKYLKDGQAIHIRVEGRTLYTDNGSHPFVGHSLVLLDYKSEGGRDKVYLHDPYKGDPTYGWTDLNTLANCLTWYEHVWK